MQAKKEVIVAPRPSTGFVSNLTRFKSKPINVQFSQVLNVAPDATGLLNLALSSANPQFWYSTGTVAGANHVFTDSPFMQPYTSHQAIYEQFRVEEVTLLFTPSRTHLTSTDINFLPMYTYFDPDSVTSPVSNSAGIQGRDFRIFRNDKSWSTSYKIPRYNHVRDVGGTADVTTEGGWMNTSVTSSLSHQAGIIQIYTEGLTADTSYGQLQVIYKVKMRTSV